MEIGPKLEDLFKNNSSVVVILVDKDERVAFVNRAYLRILNLPEEEVLGKPIDQITPETRTITTMKTGKAIIGYNWTINGYNMIACSLPLIEQGAVVGCFAYSLFMDIWDAKDIVENLLVELNMYKNEVRHLYSSTYTFQDIIGETGEMGSVKALAQKVASHSDTTVLIDGESGTGKELFAHAIHNASARCKMPFVRINCAAIPENLLEAELFGYEDGAFTGTKKGGKPGKFELANGGTIFLDEIGEMPLLMQSKLLVVLQEREIEKLGGNKPIKVNVRVIAATNRNLERMVQQGEFRNDLYYRLNVVRLEIPPLRKRAGDIPLLVKYLIPAINTRLGTRVTGVSESTLGLLSKFYWPGNVRELANLLERAMILADLEMNSTIEAKHLAFIDNQLPQENISCGGDLKSLTDEFEKKVILRVLEEAGGDKVATAHRLSIDLSSLYRKIKKYKLEL